MRLFVCFGGSAAVADDGDIEAAVVAARQRRHQRGLFRGKFLSGSSKGKEKKLPSSSETSPPAEAKKAGSLDDDGADVYGLTRASAASSVPSSGRLSSAASSLYPGSSSASASSSRSSSVSSPSSSVSGPLSTPPAAKRKAGEGSTKSPAAGAAAVVLCLLMVMLWGRIGATVLTSMALYLFPRQWPARSTHKEEEDVTVTEGFLAWNRKN